MNTRSNNTRYRELAATPCGHGSTTPDDDGWEICDDCGDRRGRME